MAWKGWEDFTPDGAEAAPPPKKRRQKYHNEPVMVGRIRFDSKREAAYYQTLKAREAAGEVEGLSRQVKFPLHVTLPSGVKHQIGAYVADFVYRERADQDWLIRIVDVKGVRTALYKWKKRHFEAEYGADIVEV